jgi:hypothetical protein
MNRERNGKLLTSTGFEVLTRRQKWRKRPDGGVVTQRTANPLPLAHSRDSSHFSRSVPGRVCYGAFVPSANRARDTHPKGRDYRLGSWVARWRSHAPKVRMLKEKVG